MKLKICILSFIFSFFWVLDCSKTHAAPTRPQLVVILMIDQFRADYLTRFEKKFLPAVKKNGEIGGFEYLKTHSAYFPQGQYDIVASITAPGHATVLTGAYPYQAGIPLNDWYDSQQKKDTYCTEDSTSALISSDNLTKANLGRSPRNMLATTVGDELKNAGFSSKVVSIALKDRAAILMGGHEADIALWFHPQTREWISSRYYFPDGKLPKWVTQLNQKVQAGPDLNIASPYGLELTTMAAEKALDAYQLGKHENTDLLALSFSSHDMVGHAKGPNSDEMEVMTLEEDRVLSHFLNTLRKKVPGGLNNVVLVLSGDHGVAASPEWAQEHKLDAGRIDEAELASQISAHLNKKYGKLSEGDWVVSHSSFNFYLNQPAILSKNLELASVEAEAKSVLLQNPHAAQVFTSSEFTQRRLPPGMFERQILHTYFPGRSGNVILIPRPFYIGGNKNSVPGSASHATGYSYDRTVPILLAGPQIRPGTYGTRAEVVDIAPTLSFLLGIIPPSLSEGRVLSEILAATRK